MATSTPLGLPIIEPGIDRIKDGAEPSALAEDINSLARATDMNISQAEERAKTAAVNDAATKYGSLPNRMTNAESKNTTQDSRLDGVESTNAGQATWLGDHENRLDTIEVTTIPAAVQTAKTAAINDAETKYGTLPARVASIKEGIQLATGRHVDEYTEPAKYFQNSNANASLALGYPVAKAGVLNVDNWGYSDGPLLMEQYYPYNHEGFFIRHVYYGSKAWKEIPSKTAVQSMINASGIAPATSSRTSVVAIGDSLTDGYSNGAAWPAADKWPTILDGLLPAASVTEYGLAGHTTDGTMLYIGAFRPRFTVPGGTIPASGAAVPVTTKQVFNIPQGLSIGGTLAGVTGVLVYDYWGGAGFTFRSLSGGTATGITGLQEFRANAIGTWEASTAIIWLGRNDISNAYAGLEADVVDHIVASTKKLIAELTPRVKQIMICGVTTRTTEESGSPQHTAVTATNARLRELFPEYFRSAQDYLRNEALDDLGITPTATDTAKIAAGTLPPSAMDDETHISRATADAMARYFFQPFLTGKGYVD